MKRILLPSMALALVWPLDEPIAAEPVASGPRGAAAIQPTPKNKLTRSRDEVLRELLRGLERQIDEINANIANLGRNNKAALRFRAVSLATYQRAWAELTRDEVDVDHEGGRETVAPLPRARP